MRRSELFGRIWFCLALACVAPAQSILSVNPDSTLLAPGARSIALSVITDAPASCRYSLGVKADFHSMTPFAEGAGATTHRTTVENLSEDPSVVNRVYLRCGPHQGSVRELKFRAVPRPTAQFPRVANLWGSRTLIEKGLEHAAKVDLQLGANYTIPQLRRLRELNPNIIILTSINAVEASDLPDDYYLKDIHGKRIEVWPGSFRLNITKPYVAEYQARRAYRLIVDSDMLYDGCFFDNVMSAQSWQKQDIYGNGVQIDADEDGKPDDPKTLNARWREGLLLELRLWRQLMPQAYAVGHLSTPLDADVAALFNGDSIGFLAPEVIEGKTSFAKLWDAYDHWFHADSRKPALTAVESAPPTQISYGYGFAPMESTPASTVAFARDFYPFMRFGLGLTLMNDGYFTHEFGDSLHGSDWQYDELNFSLGTALGPAKPIVTNAVATKDLMEQGGSWQLYTGPGTKAMVRRDRSTAGEGKSSAVVEISDAGKGVDWQVDLYQPGQSLTGGASYELRFWAKSETPREITAVISKGMPDWRNYGLESRAALGTTWKQFVLDFQAGETASDARVHFMLGERAGRVWLDGVQLVPASVKVLRRDFSNGIVLLNPNPSPQTITVGPGYRRIKGTQASRYEWIADDDGSSFRAGDQWHAVSYESGRFKPAGPYFHSWGKVSHRCEGPACADAEWTLNAPESGVYTIAAWLPAAPEATSWTRRATYELVSGGQVIASRTLDQSAGGDQWHELFQALVPAGAEVVRLRNQGTGAVIADALWVRSAARYNDGSPAPVVTLQPFDAIILKTSR